MRHAITPKDLGIDLTARRESQLFRWLMVSLLLGKPIQSQIAKQAYEKLIEADITSLDKLAAMDWHDMVRVLDSAHYVRFDYSTATKLLHIANHMKQQYGSVNGLLRQSLNISELERKLVAFNGIGPITAEIFIRGVAPVWYKQEPSYYELVAAKHAANVLHQHEYSAFIIGGAVRDLWLERQPKDFDLVTNATPRQIMKISSFRQSHFKDPAQAFGVTRVRLKLDGRKHEIEIATFRKDLEAHRGRKATKVVFAELEDDVLRRDLTINALALDLSTNFIIDYVGGVEDLENCVIRFIGSPLSRIHEDPLRLLRAIRFKNQLGFSYHPSTIKAIKQAVSMNAVETIATERLRDELTSMFIHPSRKQALVDLDSFGILERVLPEVTAGKGIEQPPQYHAEGDVWKHEQLAMDYLPPHPSSRLAWATLLHDIGKGPTIRRPKKTGERIRFDRHYAVGAELAKGVCKRLRFSNQSTNDISWMVYNHMAIDDLPHMRPSKQQRMLGHPAFEDLLELHKADAQASWRPHVAHDKKPKFKDIEHIWHQYLSKTPKYRQPSLKRDIGIDGNWLRSYFKSEFNLSGPDIGFVLDKLDEWYRDQGVTNKAAYAIKARELLQKRKNQREKFIEKLRKSRINETVSRSRLN